MRSRSCSTASRPGVQAIRDSGIEVQEANAHRYGVAVGSGIGGIHTIEQNHSKMLEAGPRRVSPFFVPATIINMISGHLSITYGMTGPNFAVVTACTTGTHSIGLAARMIQHGDADVMVAGGAEYSQHADRARRVLRGPRAVAAQRRAGQGEPTLGPRPRRLRAQRRRGLHRARGLRAREGARRADLRGVRRLRHERRRAPHHGAARRTARAPTSAC